MKAAKRQCIAVKPDGKRCEAVALVDEPFCFFHDPEKAIERQSANARGGHNGRTKTLSESGPDVEVQSAADIVRLMSQTINEVRKGALDPRVGNAVGYLANIALRAIERGDVERRLAELEAAVMTDRPQSRGLPDYDFLDEALE